MSKHCLVDSRPSCFAPKAMCAPNFAIAFAFEIKLIGGNNQNCEIIVVTSDGIFYILVWVCDHLWRLPFPMVACNTLNLWSGLRPSVAFAFRWFHAILYSILWTLPVCPGPVCKYNLVMRLCALMAALGSCGDKKQKVRAAEWKPEERERERDQHH